MNKTIGLATFARKKSLTANEHSETETNPIRQRGRGKGDVVALTVRLSRAEWERVHQLAVSEGVSIQTLAVEGLSKIFVEKGLPSLDE